MEPNGPKLDMRDWPVSKPLRSRLLPSTNDVNQMLTAVKRCLSPSTYSQSVIDDIAAYAVEETYFKWEKSSQSWASLTGYAIIVAKHKLAAHLGRSHKEVLLDDELLDTLGSRTDSIEQAIVLINAVESELPPSEKWVLKYLIEGYTQNEIAIELGITQSAVSQRIHHIRKKIQRLIQD